MAAKFKHPPYLSEQQVCDQLETIIPAVLPFGELKREMTIGSIRPDFLIFHETGIEIIEVKLTADVDSVRQLVFYKRYIEELLLNQYIDSVGAVNLNINLVFFAKSYDSKLRDLLFTLRIADFRFEINESQKVVMFPNEEDPYFLDVKEDSNFTNLIINKYCGGSANV